MTEPHAVASTMSSGLTAPAATRGWAMPAAATTATDAEPRAMRMRAAIAQARMIGETSHPPVSPMM